MTTRRIAFLLLVGMLRSASALAQGAACPGVVVPDYGYEWEGCPDCLSGRLEGGVWHAVYLAPPSLHRIRPAGPAAGKLRENDFLLAVDRLPIVSLAGQQRFQTYVPGASRVLTVRRGADTVNVAVVPLPFCRRSEAMFATTAPPISAPAWFGFGLSCGECVARPGAGGPPRWSLPPGVTIVAVEPGGPAERAGLRAGDTLAAIDGHPPHSAAGALRLREATPGRAVTFTLRRSGAPLTRQVVPIARARATNASRPDTLRYGGTVAGASVEVRGAQATVTTDPRTGAVTIRAPGVDVVIRPAPGGP